VLVLAVFILAFGMAAAAPVALLPLLVAESLGRRRFGVLAALTGIAATIGATIGPVIAGRIFDVTGGYAGAFELFILADAVGALATFVCRHMRKVLESGPHQHQRPPSPGLVRANHSAGLRLAQTTVCVTKAPERYLRGLARCKTLLLY
jgi:MFS family permease